MVVCACNHNKCITVYGYHFSFILLCICLNCNECMYPMCMQELTSIRGYHDIMRGEKYLNVSLGTKNEQQPSWEGSAYLTPK